MCYTMLHVFLGRNNRINSSLPNTPPPPYTSTDNLRQRRGADDMQLQDVNNLSLRLIWYTSDKYLAYAMIRIAAMHNSICLT